MTEILTESFCERCGTRYTFESARPRTRLKGVKVLSRGLKNFVMSDETSMDEAMAAARSETDRELTAHQLDAFHQTFNFCMSCRQYTCPNCWNEVEARCLSCAPHLGHEVLPAPFPDMPATAYPTDQAGADGSNGNGHGVELVGMAEIEAARQADEVDAAARLAALTATGPDAPTEPEPVAGIEAVVAEAEPVAEPEPEPVAGIETAMAPAALDAVVAEPVVAPPEPEPVAEPEPLAAVAAPVDETASQPVGGADEPEIDAADRLAGLAAAAIVADAVTPEAAGPARTVDEKAAAQTSGLFQRFRPGQDLDAQLDAYERERVAAAAAATAAAAAGTPEPVATPAEPAEPQPVAAEARPVADDVVPQPVWQMVAPDPGADASPGLPPDAPTLPAAATASPPGATPQWPARPEWPSASAPAVGLPFLGRRATPQGGLEAIWAESNREVATNGSSPAKAAGIQPCVSCGLSLSATAKFCRRCGTPQAG